MSSQSSEVITIKRYPNRRLYDRQSRRYITLQELEDLVVGGKKIEVRDSRTDEDLTRSILTQILLERHPEKMEMFPVAMLHGILQANDLVVEFLKAYLRQSLSLLEQMQQPTAPLSPFMSPLDWMKAMIPSGLTIPQPRSSESPSASPTDDAVAKRIAELEERLERLESRPAAKSSGPSDNRTRSAQAGTGGRRNAKSRTAALDRLEDRLGELEEESTRPRTGRP